MVRYLAHRVEDSGHCGEAEECVRVIKEFLGRGVDCGEVMSINVVVIK